MYVNNPYAQAGWHNPQNPHSINTGPGRPNSWHPPTFGALPPPEEKPASTYIFEFGFNPDIFNCAVTGPGQRKFFDIRTTSGKTVISKPGDPFAVIQWGQHPTVEARSLLARQRTGDFLKISSDRTYRTMVISGRVYAWIARDSGVHLYTAGSNPPEELARLTMRDRSMKAVLEIPTAAFQAGLFEPCVISTILLFSFLNID